MPFFYIVVFLQGEMALKGRYPTYYSPQPQRGY